MTAETIIKRFQPHVLDLRSLALFRILLGLFLLFDVALRLNLGRYSLAWYTSEPLERSILAVSDTPHKSPLHTFWFHRGTATFQLVQFGIVAVLSACFCVGFTGKHIIFGNLASGCFKILLWVFVVAMQNRCVPITDGSDSYLRLLLFWCCWLPITDKWSLDAHLMGVVQKKKTTKSTTTTASHTTMTPCVQGLPCLCLTLQQAFMYLGTVFHRTTDLYKITQLYKSVWMPPDLSAVHYALGHMFASRNHWFAQLIRTTPALSRSITASAMMIEFFAPLLCLILGPQRHIAAFMLFQLHLGLFITMNLPNWQFLGMLTQVVWIPPNVWDRWSVGASTEAATSARYKKTDGDITSKNAHTTTNSGNATDTKATRETTTMIHRQVQASNPLSKALNVLFFAYMVYDWMSNRGLVAKFDNGDIGEGLRISQYWVMYQTLSKRTEVTFLTGMTPPLLEPQHELSDEAPAMMQQRWDVLHYIRSYGHNRLQVPISNNNHTDDSDFEAVLDNICMTDQYPDPRWERAMRVWMDRGNNAALPRVQHMLQALCVLVNENRAMRGEPLFVELEMQWLQLQLLPPGSEKRWKRFNIPNVVVTESCVS